MKKPPKPIISSTIVTYNRLDYTQETIRTLLATRKLPGELIVVDNNSSDGTREWLIEQYCLGVIDKLIFNASNHYPGYARNQGWDKSCPDADYLHSSDNDMEYREGWDTEAVELFEAMPKLGQVGIMNQMQHFPEEEEIEHFKLYEENGKQINRYWWNIGGTCVIRAEMFRDENIRWLPERWEAKINEDAKYSNLVKERGYFIGNVIPDLCRHMSLGNYEKHLDYYMQTFQDRDHIGVLEERLEAERNGEYVSGKRATRKNMVSHACDEPEELDQADL